MIKGQEVKEVIIQHRHILQTGTQHSVKQLK